MENKKKPSLRFVQSHHHFDDPGTLFDPEMLSWPIWDGREKEISKINTGIYHRAFEALTSLTPFETKVSMEVDPLGKKFMLPKRVWAEIYLKDELVLSFSHDTRFDNRAFYSLLEWSELTKLNYLSDDEYAKDWKEIVNTLFSWSVAQWSDFFKQRLLRRAETLKKKADGKMKDAELLVKSADLLLSVLF